MYPFPRLSICSRDSGTANRPTFNLEKVRFQHPSLRGPKRNWVLAAPCRQLALTLLFRRRVMTQPMHLGYLSSKTVSNFAKSSTRSSLELDAVCLRIL